jgi:hypothetical protein
VPGTIDRSGSGPSRGSDALSTFEAATTVIGQSDFTTGGCSNPAANTLCDPYNVVANKKLLYISDADYSRVLGFKKVPTSNGASANFVLGQTNFSNTTFAVGQAALSFPTAVVIAGKKLLVNDFDNSRVLIWNKLPTKTHAPANVVPGQPNFNSSTGSTGASGLDRPEAGLEVAGGKLFVAERNNNRILDCSSLGASCW